MATVRSSIELIIRNIQTGILRNQMQAGRAVQRGRRNRITRSWRWLRLLRKRSSSSRGTIVLFTLKITKLLQMSLKFRVKQVRTRASYLVETSCIRAKQITWTSLRCLTARNEVDFCSEKYRNSRVNPKSSCLRKRRRSKITKSRSCRRIQAFTSGQANARTPEWSTPPAIAFRLSTRTTSISTERSS